MACPRLAARWSKQTKEEKKGNGTLLRGPIILRRATSGAIRACAEMATNKRHIWPVSVCLALVMLTAPLSGCGLGNGAAGPAFTPPRVVVVTPVLNLSGSEDFDPLRVTDLVASELAGFAGVSVVPVNRVLAELALQGRTLVETPQDALQLARTFGADAAVVTAVTEYDPYDPPVIGLIMQWYEETPATQLSGFNPVTASRLAADLPRTDHDGAASVAPRWQVQRIFDASDEELLVEVKRYADRHEGQRSPYGWRKYYKAQELYLRFCSHLLIKTIHQRLNEYAGTAVEPHEAG